MKIANDELFSTSYTNNLCIELTTYILSSYSNKKFIDFATVENMLCLKDKFFSAKNFLHQKLWYSDPSVLLKGDYSNHRF